MLSYSDTNLLLSIVAVPPIGAHHRKTWIAHGATSSWLDTELLQHIPRARVLLYNYGDLGDDKIDTLGEKLLNQLRSERKHEVCYHLLFSYITLNNLLKISSAKSTSHLSHLP